MQPPSGTVTFLLTDLEGVDQDVGTGSRGDEGRDGPLLTGAIVSIDG